MGSSTDAAGSGIDVSCSIASSCPSSSCLRSSRVRRRSTSIALRFAAGGEPRARIVRDTGSRPLLEREEQRVLREVLGLADIAHHPREARDDPGRLDSPDGFDRAVDRRFVA